MDQAVHMLMVPAGDMETLRKFYIDGLGWRSWGPEVPGSLMLRAGTVVIVFVPRAYLAAESGIDLSAVAPAVKAIFVETKAGLNPQLPTALPVGATITSPIPDRHGGPYSGYFPAPTRNGRSILWGQVILPRRHSGG